MTYIVVGSLALILIMWLATRVQIARRKNLDPKPPEPQPVDLESLLVGAELVAYVRNEKLFLTTGGQWLFIQQLKDRLNYSTLTPWKARNYILTHVRKENLDDYHERKMEILSKYNLKGDKKNLHYPHVEQMIRGRMMIGNRSESD